MHVVNAVLHLPMAMLVLEEKEGTRVVYHTLRGSIAPQSVLDAPEGLKRIAGKSNRLLESA